MAQNNKQHSNNINIKNRKATFDYEILETFTAGIVLTGTEIKSLRQGKAGLTDTYCMVENHELWVKNMYIAEYSYGSYLIANLAWNLGGREIFWQLVYFNHEYIIMPEYYNGTLGRLDTMPFK